MKGTWKILKQAMGQESKSSIIEKVIHKGCEISDRKQMANICNEHFVSVGKMLAVNIPDTGESPTVFHKVMTFQAEKAMKKYIKSKATAIHNIPNKILKNSCQVIAPFLTDIFNFSITSNISPDDLKIDKVSPVHKSGDKDDLNNYRPITVLPTIARVSERLLQIYTYLTENKLLGNQQFGFRSIHSTAVNKWLMNEVMVN